MCRSCRWCINQPTTRWSNRSSTTHRYSLPWPVLISVMLVTLGRRRRSVSLLMLVDWLNGGGQPTGHLRGGQRTVALGRTNFSLKTKIIGIRSPPLASKRP